MKFVPLMPRSTGSVQRLFILARSVVHELVTAERHPF